MERLKIIYLGSLLYLTNVVSAQSGNEPFQDFIEHLTIEVNRSYFIPGEELSLAVQCRVRDSQYSISNVLYMELLSSEGTSVIQEKIQLENGLGNASVFLPSQLESGIYKLVCYTSWMKNFGQQSFFERKIQLINPFVALPQSLFQDKVSMDSVHLELFPEGGTFLKETNQNVAYCIRNKYGEMVPVGLKILDQEANVVFERSSSNGFGSFLFNVESNHTYKVIFTDDQEQIEYSSFHIGTLYERSIELIESASSIMVKSLSDETLSIQVDKAGLPSLGQRTELAGKRHVTFNKSDLPRGLLRIRVINQQTEVLYSASVFNAPVKRELMIELDKRSYHLRDSIKLKIQDSTPFPVTVVVRKIQEVHPENNLIRTFFLGKNLENFPINWPVSPVLNEFLLMSSVSRTTANSAKNEYLPDLKGELVTGMIRSKGGDIVPDHSFFATISGSEFELYSVKSDSKGVFRFSINNQRSGHEITFSGLGNYNIDLKSPFFENHQLTNREELRIHIPNHEEWLLQKAQQVQILNLYSSQHNRNSLSPLKSINGLSSKKDITTYLLDDYTRFPTVGDHIVEYIPNVMIRKEGDQEQFVMRNVLNKSIEDSDVLVTMNGMVWPLKQVLECNPSSIEKIEVLQKQFKLGENIYSGAVNFLTYSDHIIERKELLNYPVFSIKKPLKGLGNGSQEVQFGKRLPDMRIQLGWLPNAQLTSESNVFSFQTSDVPGNYEVIISGLNESSYVFERILFSVAEAH